MGIPMGIPKRGLKMHEKGGKVYKKQVKSAKKSELKGV